MTQKARGSEKDEHRLTAARCAQAARTSCGPAAHPSARRRGRASSSAQKQSPESLKAGVFLGTVPFLPPNGLTCPLARGAGGQGELSTVTLQAQGVAQQGPALSFLIKGKNVLEAFQTRGDLDPTALTPTLQSRGTLPSLNLTA